MNEDQAFKALDLPQKATEDEINQRFRALASKAHPDRGGDTETMANLIKARQIALEKARRNTRTKINPAQEIQRINIEIDKRTNQSKKTKELHKELTHKHTHQLKKIQLATLITAITMGLITLIGLQVIIITSLPSIITNIAATLTVASILTLLITSSMKEERENNLNELLEILNEQSTFQALIDLIKLPYLTPPTWTQEHLESIINQWMRMKEDEPKKLRELAALIGKKDFTSLILSNGMEQGVIREHTTIEGHKEKTRYTLRGLGRRHV